MRKIFLLVTSCLFFTLTALGHGVIEKPASREQFCGVESKPDEIYQSKLTHEKCRPIMTKADGSLDNSIYNFMAVLTHTTGRQGRTQANLPKHVCGFDSENWGGGKTPWDNAMDWPTSSLTAGSNQFVWNINWGNHFSDTEEFAYWITKADFKFPTDRELSWSDFEDKPFCLLKYDDKNPSANPNIRADKSNNKFYTTCTVPARTDRAVIYAEWGRNYATFERFHTCIDVVFSGDSTPGTTVKAVMAPFADTIKGASEITLDASKSQGQNLSYQWTISAADSSLYTLTNANQAIAKLSLKNTNSEQRVVVNLAVRSGNYADNTSLSFLHLPLTNDTWRQIGTALSNNTLAEGDQVALRLIDQSGKDFYFPSSPIVLSAENAKAANWSYVLAQAINGKNNYSITLGVLNSATNLIVPVYSETENKVYVPKQSAFTNAYVVIQKKEQATGSCVIKLKSGNSAYWMGYDIYADKAPILVDFATTGIDLNKVNIDQGVFSTVSKISSTKLLINAKPSWVSKTTPGYIGFNAANYGPLATSIAAVCTAG